MGRHSASDESQSQLPPVPVAPRPRPTEDFAIPPLTAGEYYVVEPSGDIIPDEGFVDDDDTRENLDLAGVLRSRMEEEDGRVGFPNPTESPEEAPGRRPRVPRKFAVAVGVAALAGAVFCGFRFSHDNPNGYRPGGQVESEGPNIVPTKTINGEPLDTAEQRAAAVQRAVNNGEYKKTVPTLPGELTYTGTDGRERHVRNPIIVTEGLPSDSTKIDPKDNALGGRIFGLTLGGYDPNKGAGQSYNLVPIDPTKVTGWQGTTNPEDIVNVAMAWDKGEAGEGLDPQSGQPYMQAKDGRLLPPGTPDTAANGPYIVGDGS